MRAVIYARYSSDLQREASIEDQVRECSRLAERLGYQVIEVFSDSAMSGSTDNRPGLQKLLAYVNSGLADIVIAEALDRISRDQEHVAGIFKRVSFAQSKIHTIAEGEISELHIGLKGTMNALFLKDLAEKIRRGQKGRAIAKRSPGGLPYGYDVIRRFGDDGKPDTGLRSINQEQAKIIRLIFTNYSLGMSGRSIAKSLNEAGIPSPRGGLWNSTTIIGNRARRDGILWNEAYLGKILYNRQKFVKNPKTGKRIPRINPKKDWIIVDAPELRIITDSEWAAVHERLDKQKSLPLVMRRNPKRLFSGLIYCCECSGPMTIVGEGRIGCSNHRERGNCTNNKKISIERIEDTVLLGIKDQMLQPALIEEFEKEFHTKMKELSAAENTSIADHSKTILTVSQQIEKIVDSIAVAGPLPSLTSRLKELEGKKDNLLRNQPIHFSDLNITLPRKDMTSAYKARIERFKESLNADPELKIEATGQIRTLVKSIVVHPLPGKGNAALEITGDISALAVLDLPGQKTAVSMVAEEGFEPPTQGL